MVKTVKNLYSKTIAFSKKSLLAGSALVAATGSQLALAVDDATVTAAQAAGEASVLNATNGLLAIIAVVVGISLVLSVMKKA